MKMRKKIDQDGFTILEVLVAMIILSMSLLLLLNMAMVALDGNDWSNNTTRATQLLQEKLEQLRSMPNNLTAGSDSAGGLARQWTVDNIGSHLRQVNVTVIWTDIRSNTKSTSMSTFVKTDSI